MTIGRINGLVRASLFALAGSRRAALLGMEGFCLCHFVGKFLETTLYGLNVGQIGANAWLYWQLAVLPGGLWQHFSSIPTFLLPRARQCFHPEVNIDEVTLSTLSMLFHNKTCTRSAMESVIVGKGF